MMNEMPNRMKRGFCVLVLLIFLIPMSKAQHQEISEKSDIYKNNQLSLSDTTSLLSAFKRGHFNGHFRYFFMSTQNQKGLTDFYANAVGGSLKYETAIFQGFQFGVSGFYSFNIGSSDFTKADPATGLYNRYEVALFDIENPANKKDLDRLEEFYLKYLLKKSSITIGRQLLNTPFINLQDGRMRPTSTEGIWVEINEIKNLKIEGGWLYAISPRGTTKWSNTNQSIGVSSTGVNVDGSKSQYKNNLTGKGIFMLGLHSNLNQNIKLQFWDVFTENIFNTALFQADISIPLKDESTLFAAAQIVKQDAINYGGNTNPAKAYFEKNGESLTFGLRAGWKNNRWEASINYNRITAKGRYLMPREWGREPFFTFLARERNDGFGDVHALLGKLSFIIPEARIKTSLGVGHYQLPDVKNYRLNKYGLPSYSQVNFDIRYKFAKFFQGFETQLLVVGKIKNGETYNDKRFEFNKVNMVLYNFVLNYNF
ncbi:MAG: outer membrane porin, OprD family [Bacteroidia bacterium]|nr:outer membrane porin, OprD family [Bacteroidia bacterium]